MPGIVPNEGELRLLAELMDGATARENWLLKLMRTAVTPAETDTAASYTEANFTNYAAKTLNRSVGGANWSTPASGAPTGGWSAEAAVAESTYGGGTPQSWTCGATGNTIYGYWYEGATSGKVLLAEQFATPRTLALNDVLNFTPRFGLS